MLPPNLKFVTFNELHISPHQFMQINAIESLLASRRFRAIDMFELQSRYDLYTYAQECVQETDPANRFGAIYTLLYGRWSGVDTATLGFLRWPANRYIEFPAPVENETDIDPNMPILLAALA